MSPAPFYLFRWSGLFIFPRMRYDGGMASAKPKRKGKGAGLLQERNKGRRNREFDFEEYLAEIHGDNPDDWLMIYEYSYNYILSSWKNEKKPAPQGGSRDKDNSSAQDFGAETSSLAQLDDSDRESCLQDAFVLLVYKEPVFKTLGQARAWVMHTAANLAGTEYKNRKKGTSAAMDSYFSEEGYLDRTAQEYDRILDEIDKEQLRHGKSSD